MHRLLLMLACCALTADMSAADPSGPAYRGPAITGGAMYRVNQRRSGVFQRDAPLAAPTPAWQVELGGEIRSSPVVWKETLYLGTPSGIVALDAGTGRERWRHPVKAGVDGSACVAATEFGTTVFFVTRDDCLVALDAVRGSLLWTYAGKPSGTPSRTSPLVDHGAVFAVVGKEIVALRYEDGTPLYSIGKNVPLEYCSLAGTADELYGMGTMNWGYLFAYDYASHRVLWRSNGPFESGAGVYFFKSPAIDSDGAIYINETRRINKFRPDHQGGAPAGQRGRMWGTFLLDKQVDDNELIAQSSPTPWNGLVFGGRKDGKFVALTTDRGEVAWQKRYGAACLSDPSVAAKSGLVLFGCDDGKIRALEAGNGNERWSHDCGAPIFASPWIEDGRVFIATTGGMLFALH